jgi:3',5'-cyclic AMP phosphodiesterase CpdA
MVVVQISDPHVTPYGASPGAGVDSFSNLSRAIARANALQPKPAAIVISGDLVEHGTRDEYRRLAQALAASDVPVHLMTGNHDDRDALAGVFPELASRIGAYGLQYVVDLGPLRLVLLDSLIEGTSAGALEASRLAWLDDRLREARDTPAIVFVHHPPVLTGLAHVDGSALIDPGALESVIASHANVLRVASGHIHCSLAAAFGGTTLSVCPSTAHQFALDLRDQGRIVAVAEPPAFQVHRFGAGRLFTYTRPVD